MERHKCKLCSRTFINGKALGGHMKAHLATLPLPPKKNLSLPNPNSTPDTSSVSECETESKNNNPTRRRSKRTRKPNFDRFQFHVVEDNKKPKLMDSQYSPDESVSSVSYTSIEEYIAMCLIMLSKDKWNVKEEKEEEDEEEEEVGIDRSVDDDRKDRIFECPFCFKVFGSGQALGGHKRSHMYPSSSSIMRQKKEISFIDLNLPAPVEEEDEEEEDEDDPSVLSHA